MSSPCFCHEPIRWVEGRQAFVMTFGQVGFPSQPGSTGEVVRAGEEELAPRSGAGAPPVGDRAWYVDSGGDGHDPGQGRLGAIRWRPERAATARGRRSAAAPVAAAPHPPPCPRRRRDRQSPTLGTGRGPARPARRGGRRPRAFRAGHPPRGGRVPDREDFRRLATRRVLHPGPDPTGATHPGMGAPPGEHRGLRAVPDR